MANKTADTCTGDCTLITIKFLTSTKATDVICRPPLDKMFLLDEMMTCLKYKTSDTCTSKTGCKWSDLMDADAQKTINDTVKIEEKAATTVPITTKPAVPSSLEPNTITYINNDTQPFTVYWVV